MISGDNSLSVYNGSPKTIKWEITRRCNYRCDYCGIWKNNQQALNPIDIKKMAEGFNYLQGVWKFDITGGEPFLEEKIIDICREIEKRHYITLNTNLSTPNVYDFADQINPERILINSSVHVTEREKIESNFSSFIEKILYLQQKGFNILVGYVAHPVLFSRIKQDIATLKSEGIQNVSIKIFNGKYNGKYYPDSFDTKQKEFLQCMEAAYPEFLILNQTHDYHGHLCQAGMKSFAMDRDGNLSRCSSVTENYGNLFEKQVSFDDKAKPCPETQYLCLHECLANRITTKERIFLRFKRIFSK